MTIAEIQTLIAGIETSFLEEQVWRHWSERALLVTSPVPVWLVDLYNAEDSEHALAALYQGWGKSNRALSAVDQTELYLGFLYLRYLANNLSLPKLLLEAGEYSDKVNFDNPSREAFYMVLDEYEGRENSPPYTPETFDQRVESLFISFGELAKKQLSFLQRTG